MNGRQQAASNAASNAAGGMSAAFDDMPCGVLAYLMTLLPAAEDRRSCAAVSGRLRRAALEADVVARSRLLLRVPGISVGLSRPPGAALTLVAMGDGALIRVVSRDRRSGGHAGGGHPGGGHPGGVPELVPELVAADLAEALAEALAPRGGAETREALARTGTIARVAESVAGDPTLAFEVEVVGMLPSAGAAAALAALPRLLSVVVQPHLRLGARRVRALASAGDGRSAAGPLCLRLPRAGLVAADLARGPGRALALPAALTDLDLSDTALGGDGAMGRAAALPATLAHLDVHNCGLGDDGFVALGARCAALPALATLRAGHNSVGRGALAAGLDGLAGHAVLATLSLSGNDTGGEAALAIGRLPALRCLEADFALFGADAFLLAGLAGLRRLDLSQCDLDDTDTPHIAGMRRLVALNLSINGIADPSPLLHGRLPELTDLDLSWNDLGEDGVMALCAPGAMPAIRALDISNNCAGARGLIAMCKGPPPTLRTLAARHCGACPASVKLAGVHIAGRGVDASF